MSNAQISSDMGCIKVRGSLQQRPHLRIFSAILYNEIKKQGFQDIILDFLYCDGVYESFMLPLLPLIEKYANSGVNFTIVLPEDEKLERLFINTNWAYYISPKGYKRVDHEGGHIPAIRFNDSDDQQKIVDRIMKLVLFNLGKMDRNDLKALEWSLNEIIDNVLTHSKSSLGGFVQATAFTEKRQVEFIVADGGIGIPESMRKGGKRYGSQKQALKEAIDEGVTSDKSQNAGNGLFGSYRVAMLSGGEFEINSLNAHLFGDGKKELTMEDESIPYDGTSIRCSINFDTPNLLGEALKFKGTPHNPSHDYIERRYESGKENEMNFVMKEHESTFGSRRGGGKVRQIMETLLSDGNRVVVDFSGVGVISSSFADEVFGRLFVNMGLFDFNSRIRIVNADPTVQGLIERAVVQRTRLGNGESGEGAKEGMS